jgi:hypothetical protein
MYQNTLLTLFSMSLVFAKAHVMMKEPNNGGVDTEPAKQLCKGAKGKHATPLKAGSSLRVVLSGTATHEGGGCQFGLSYDGGKTFTVIMTTDDKCPMTQQYEVPIPANAPSCSNCVFAWGWVPRQSGAPEYYMNCAEVSIEGSRSGGKLQGPEMKFFNMPGFPQVHYDNKDKSKTLGLTDRFGPYGLGSNSTTNVESSADSGTTGNNGYNGRNGSTGTLANSGNGAAPCPTTNGGSSIPTVPYPQSSPSSTPSISSGGDGPTKPPVYQPPSPASPSVISQQEGTKQPTAYQSPTVSSGGERTNQTPAYQPPSSHHTRIPPNLGNSDTPKPPCPSTNVATLNSKDKSTAQPPVTPNYATSAVSNNNANKIPATPPTLLPLQQYQTRI